MSAKKPAHIVNEGLLSLTQVGLLSFSVRNSSYLFKLFLRDLLQGVVSQELLDKVDVGHKHSPAAISIQTQGIQSLPVVVEKEGRKRKKRKF